MKLVIVDDDPLVSASLRTILEVQPDISVLALGKNGNEAVMLYEKHRPDVLLMDIRMPELDGIGAAQQILNRFPDAIILFLTTFSDDDYIVKALSIGAKGYLLKQDFESILPALNAVVSGQSVFGSDIVSKLPELLQNKRGIDYRTYDISAKEEEIIGFVASGMSNKEIADTLFLSEGTVRNYLSVILDKLDLRDRTQLAIFYYKNK